MLSSLGYWPRVWLTVGCVSFALSAVLTPLAIFTLRRFGVLDEVSENKIHKIAVPRGGGLVIFIAFAAAVLLPGYRSIEMNGLLLGALICLLVGAVDDFTGGVPGIYKLATLCAVALLLSHFNVRVNFFPGHPWLDIFLTMAWLVGVTSALNGIDNMDGLASGITVIVAGVFFLIAFAAGTETSLSWFGMLAIGLVGANLGFLLYNFHPAKIFMGDSGSFFLGYTLAALGVMGEWAGNRLISCTIPVLILGVPLFDFAYIIIARIWRGETRSIRSIIDHCAPDHLSHRLLWMGFSTRKAVLFIYLIALALGASGWLLRRSDSLMDILIALFQGLAIAAIVIILMATSERRHRERATEGVEKRKDGGLE